MGQINLRWSDRYSSVSNWSAVESFVIGDVLLKGTIAEQGFKMSRRPRRRQQERQRRNGFRLESFRFEEEIWIKVFSRILKNWQPRKLHCTFFAPEKLELLSVLMEIKTM